MPHVDEHPARRFPRLAVAAVLLFGHLVATFGWPFPVDASAKLNDPRGLYPCSDHPCGCATYDQCWAGDCCCFTLAEKVAWAGANGVTVPSHVPALMAAREEKTCCPAQPTAKRADCCATAKVSCCKTESEPPKPCRVIGIFAQKCRGLKIGFGALEPARPLVDDANGLDSPLAGDRPFAHSVRFTSFTSPPPSPPPNRG